MLNKKRKKDYSLNLYLAIIGIFLAGLVGWIMNVVELYHADDLLSGAAIVRIIGVFVAPLGAIMGYF